MSHHEIHQDQPAIRLEFSCMQGLHHLGDGEELGRVSVGNHDVQEPPNRTERSEDRGNDRNDRDGRGVEMVTCCRAWKSGCSPRMTLLHHRVASDEHTPANSKAAIEDRTCICHSIPISQTQIRMRNHRTRVLHIVSHAHTRRRSSVVVILVNIRGRREIWVMEGRCCWTRDLPGWRYPPGVIYRYVVIPVFLDPSSVSHAPKTPKSRSHRIPDVCWTRAIQHRPTSTDSSRAIQEDWLLHRIP